MTSSFLPLVIVSVIERVAGLAEIASHPLFLSVLIGFALLLLAAAAVDAAWRRPPLRGSMYQVIAPRSGANPEQFFRSLYGLLESPWRRLRNGQPWVGCELGGSDGQVRFYLWIPDAAKPTVYDALAAAYPGASLRPLDDDPLTQGQEEGAAARVGLTESTYLPVARNVDASALTALLSALARAGEGESTFLSLLVRPRAGGWQARARQAAERLRTGRRGEVVEALRGSEPRRAATTWARERAKLIDSKAADIGFDCALRLRSSAPTRHAANALLRAAAGSLPWMPNANRFRYRTVRRASFAEANRARRFPLFGSFILTPPELAALWRLPEEAPPFVDVQHSRVLPAPAGLPSKGRTIGVAAWRDKERRAMLSIADSRRHLHVLGPTGTGKTTLLANLALQDLAAGRGVAVIDPKGDLVDRLLDRMPAERVRDVVLIEPADAERVVGINPLAWSKPDERALVAENVLSILKHIYSRHWGIRTDDILKAALLTLTERPDATICEIPLLLEDSRFRKESIARLKDPVGLSSFWRWYESLSASQRAEAVGPVLNKLRDVLVRPRVRRLLCQKRSTVSMEDVLGSGRILLASLPTGRWGEAPAALIGSFLVASLWQAAQRRAAIPEGARSDFSLYVDEFQHFVGMAGNFADALAEARSFRLSLTLANQHLGQLSADLREAISSNARSRICFQLGAADARAMARELAPLTASDLMSLGRGDIAARLSVDGVTSPTFTAKAAPPTGGKDPVRALEAVMASREQFGLPVSEVDAEIRSVLAPEPPPAPKPPRHGVGRRPRKT